MQGCLHVTPVLSPAAVITFDLKTLKAQAQEVAQGVSSSARVLTAIDIPDRRDSQDRNYPIYLTEANVYAPVVQRRAHKAATAAVAAATAYKGPAAAGAAAVATAAAAAAREGPEAVLRAVAAAAAEAAAAASNGPAAEAAAEVAAKAVAADAEEAAAAAGAQAATASQGSAAVGEDTAAAGKAPQHPAARPGDFGEFFLAPGVTTYAGQCIMLVLDLSEQESRRVARVLQKELQEGGRLADEITARPDRAVLTMEESRKLMLSIDKYDPMRVLPTVHARGERSTWTTDAVSDCFNWLWLLRLWRPQVAYAQAVTRSWTVHEQLCLECTVPSCRAARQLEPGRCSCTPCSLRELPRANADHAHN